MASRCRSFSASSSRIRQTKGTYVCSPRPQECWTTGIFAARSRQRAPRRRSATCLKRGPIRRQLEAERTLTGSQGGERSTLSSGLRAVRKQSAHSDWVVTASHLLAKSSVSEHLRDLCKHLQMVLGRVLRHQKYHHMRHRFRVGCVEGYGQLERHKSRHGLRQVIDACMRKSDAQA